MLESRWFHPSSGKNADADVDKSVVVIGGFGDKAVEEVESIVKELMITVNGYQDAQVVESTLPLFFSRIRSSGDEVRREAGPGTCIGTVRFPHSSYEIHPCTKEKHAHAAPQLVGFCEPQQKGADALQSL